MFILYNFCYQKKICFLPFSFLFFRQDDNYASVLQYVSPISSICYLGQTDIPFYWLILALESVSVNLLLLSWSCHSRSLQITSFSLDFGLSKIVYLWSLLLLKSRAFLERGPWLNPFICWVVCGCSPWVSKSAAQRLAVTILKDFFLQKGEIVPDYTKASFG